MPRTARQLVGGLCYHVVNRGNRREQVFHSNADYMRFLSLIGQARTRVPMPVLTYCLMPNHFHLLVRPHADGDLSRWMHWLLTAHVRRHHLVHGTDGHVWQGRYKAIAVADDRHLAAVARYIERNPVRARLVSDARAWSWSSLHLATSIREASLGDVLPQACSPRWLAYVNEPQSAAELAAVRECTNKGLPFGPPRWQRETAERLGLDPGRLA